MSLQTHTSESQAKRAAKHVTTACLGCRRRKIKCDGGGTGSPRCSNCILYGQECVFQHGVDKRKIAPKERLQSLTSYCQQLESLLIASGIDLPSPPPMHVQTNPNGNHATSSCVDTPLSESLGQDASRPEIKSEASGEH